MYNRTIYLYVYILILIHFFKKSSRVIPMNLIKVSLLRRDIILREVKLRPHAEIYTFILMSLYFLSFYQKNPRLY